MGSTYLQPEGAVKTEVSAPEEQTSTLLVTPVEMVEKVHMITIALVTSFLDV